MLKTVRWLSAKCATPSGGFDDPHQYDTMLGGRLGEANVNAGAARGGGEGAGVGRGGAAHDVAVYREALEVLHSQGVDLNAVTDGIFGHSARAGLGDGLGAGAGLG